MAMPRRIPWKPITAMLVVAAVIAAIRLLPVREEIVRFQSWVEGAGALGYVVYAVVYAVATVFLVPGSILTLGAGAVFGVVRGTLVVIAGATAGATLAFLLARTAARERVRRYVSGNASFEAIDRAIAREGTKIVFLMRLSVVFPFTWINYALGLTGVRTLPYILSTLVGIAPATLAFVYIGALAGEAASAAHVRLLVYAIGAAAALTVSIVIGRIAVTQIRKSGIHGA